MCPLNTKRQGLLYSLHPYEDELAMYTHTHNLKVHGPGRTRCVLPPVKSGSSKAAKSITRQRDKIKAYQRLEANGLTRKTVPHLVTEGEGAVRGREYQDGKHSNPKSRFSLSFSYLLGRYNSLFVNSRVGRPEQREAGGGMQIDQNGIPAHVCLVAFERKPVG